MRAVNLLPADRRDSKRRAGQSSKTPVLAVCGAVGVLVAGGLSYMVWSSNSTVDTKTKQLGALQQQLASLPTPTTGASSTAAAGNDVRLAAVTGLANNRLAWDQFLNTLSRVIPEDVWLQNLQAQSGGAAATLQAAQAAAAAAAAGPTTTSVGSTTTAAAAPPPTTSTGSNTFTIQGYTYSQPSVARLMRRLSVVPWLTGVSLVSSTKSEIGNDEVVNFNIKASVVTPVIP
jgi:Tfp pilus assembly protein PilN